YTKSGCPFFVMINEGNEKIEGRLVTDIAAKAEVFDPFTGTASPISASLHDSGFAYPVNVGAHESKIIGMDPSALPVLEEPEKIVLSEIVSLGEGRMTFDFKPEVGRHAILSFTKIDEIADIRVNGKDATRLIFKPYETDITNYLHSGENTVEIELTGSIACKYGSPVPAGFEGCTVRICDKPNAEGAAKGENDEMWDVYDKDRRQVGRLQRRGDSMKDGDYHIVVHVWIRNKNGEYLLTKRAPDKMFPLSWECTGGSALAGEDSLTAALREVREETGLKLDPANGSVVIHADGDNYFGDIWLFREEFDLDKVRLQAGETVDKRKATKDEIIALIESCEFVPYDYLGRLFEID
ncbi:MAG: NUDIX domain-containing protein, partial [bacterium]|nr:NUDIX domain-containing protein [bacterium]